MRLRGGEKKNGGSLGVLKVPATLDKSMMHAKTKIIQPMIVIHSLMELGARKDKVDQNFFKDSPKEKEILSVLQVQVM